MAEVHGNQSHTPEHSNAVDRRSILKSVIALGGLTLLASEQKAKAQGTGPSKILKKQTDSEKAPTESVAAPVRVEGLESIEAAINLKRTGVEAEEWEVLLKKLQSEFPITSNGLLSGVLDTKVKSIDCDFEQVTQPYTAGTTLNPLHVEPLLNQAADLLDRAVVARTNWDELGRKRFELLANLHEFAKLDEIHQKEEQAGLYDIPYKEAISEWNSTRALYENTSNSASHARFLLESILRPNFFPNYVSRVKSAWLSGLVSYSFGTGDFNGYASHIFNNVNKTVSDHMFDAAEDLAGVDLNERIIRSQIDHSISLASAQSARERLAGQKIRADWENRNRVFKAERTKVARDLQDIKVKATLAKDGILNYERRMTPLKSSFFADAKNAIDRLLAVTAGLKSLYGYTVPLPNPTRRPNLIDDFRTWTRDAIDWLNRFSRNEQSVVSTFSLRSELGSKNWRAGLKKGKWIFEIPKEYFPSMAHVRIRGISFHTVGPDDVMLYLVIRPPVNSLVKHLTDRDWRKFSQKSLKPVHAGRVQSREVNRNPDVVGMSSLYNASPVGVWEICILRTAKTDRNILDLFDKVGDIHLDLDVAFQSI